MAFARTAVHPRELSSSRSSAKRGFWQRFFDAMVASRQRQAEREIALYLHDRGGKLTDDVEREIERRFLGPTHW